MKIHLLGLIAIFSASVSSQEYRVVERGAHHRLLEQVTADPYRRSGFRTNYINIKATGLHYWADGQWRDSQELIEIAGGVAISRYGPHQVIFPGDVLGEIDLLTPDQKRMRSRVVGLMYVDRESGASVPQQSTRSTKYDTSEDIDNYGP